MSRRIIYGCDNCGVDFGDATHLNIKKIQLFVSSIDSQQRWIAKKIKHMPGVEGELHFCNAACLNEYLAPKITKAQEEENKADAIRRF